MALRVACVTCCRTFDAVRHAGLVRCASCEDLHGLSLPSTGITVLVLDTPGEAWV